MSFEAFPNEMQKSPVMPSSSQTTFLTSIMGNNDNNNDSNSDTLTTRMHGNVVNEGIGMGNEEITQDAAQDGAVVANGEKMRRRANQKKRTEELFQGGSKAKKISTEETVDGKDVSAVPTRPLGAPKSKSSSSIRQGRHLQSKNRDNLMDLHDNQHQGVHKGHHHSPHRHKSGNDLHGHPHRKHMEEDLEDEMLASIQKQMEDAIKLSSSILEYTPMVAPVDKYYQIGNAISEDEIHDAISHAVNRAEVILARDSERISELAAMNYGDDELDKSNSHGDGELSSRLNNLLPQAVSHNALGNRLLPSYELQDFFEEKARHLDETKKETSMPMFRHHQQRLLAKGFAVYEKALSQLQEQHDLQAQFEGLLRTMQVTLGKDLTGEDIERTAKEKLHRKRNGAKHHMHTPVTSTDTNNTNHRPIPENLREAVAMNVFDILDAGSVTSTPHPAANSDVNSEISVVASTVSTSQVPNVGELPRSSSRSHSDREMSEQLSGRSLSRIAEEYPTGTSHLEESASTISHNEMQSQNMQAITEMHLRNLAAAEAFLAGEQGSITVNEDLKGSFGEFVTPTSIEFDPISKPRIPIRVRNHPSEQKPNFIDKVKKDIHRMTSVGRERVEKIALRKKIESETAKALAAPSPKSLKPGASAAELRKLAKKKKALNRLGYDAKTGLFGADPISERMSKVEMYAIQRKKRYDEEEESRLEIQLEYQRALQVKNREETFGGGGKRILVAPALSRKQTFDSPRSHAGSDDTIGPLVNIPRKPMKHYKTRASHGFRPLAHQILVGAKEAAEVNLPQRLVDAQASSVGQSNLGQLVSIAHQNNFQLALQNRQQQHQHDQLSEDQQPNIDEIMG